MKKMLISRGNLENVVGGVIYLGTAVDVQDDLPKGVILFSWCEGDYFGVIVNRGNFKAFGLTPGEAWIKKAAQLEVKDEIEEFEDFDKLFEAHPWARKSFKFLQQ